MSRSKESDSDKPIPLPEDEDEATLAAIDEGIRDAEAGRTVPASEARRLLQKWITKSASPKDRENDLAEIIEHIAHNDAEAASRFGQSLLDHVDLLSRFPRMGIYLRKRPHIRKLLHSPIFVYYRIIEARGLVEIVHFRHSARLPL